VLSSGTSLSSASGSVSDSVSSDLWEFWYSSLLSLLCQTVVICCCASGSPSGSLYTVVCKVLLLARFTGRDVGRLVVCGGEELRPDDCVPWELLDSAGSLLVLWELPDLVRCVPDLDPRCAGMASRLRCSRLPTCEVG